MRFKFLGTEIYISLMFGALITVILLFDKTGIILPLLFAVFMHETGHLFMMYLMGAAPKKIKLIPASIQITKPFNIGYKNDIVISIFGPIVNLFLFLVFYYNYYCHNNITTLYIALLNLIIGVFNLLPIKGLDGGTVLYCVLCKYVGINKAELILNFITFFCGVSLLLLAVILTLKGRINISFYIMGIYLLIVTIVKR